LDFEIGGLKLQKNKNRGIKNALKPKMFYQHICVVIIKNNYFKIDVVFFLTYLHICLRNKFFSGK
jgi:hypothetical protein